MLNRQFSSQFLFGRIFILISLLSLILGCNSNEDNKNISYPQSSDAQLKIGLSFSDLTQERWKKDRDLFIKYANDLGAEVLVRDASSDAQYQIEQCKNLILQGVQVLVVVSRSAIASAPIISEAKKKGVKVIAYDRMLGTSDLRPDFFISFDNYRIGRIQAEELLKIAPTGKYLLLGGDPADWNAQLINKAHLEALETGITTGKIEVVGNKYCDKWGRSEATRYTEDILTKAPTLTAIVGANDGIAGGAIAALKSKNLHGKVLVSGQDADLEACQNIAKGFQTISVYKPIDKLARAAALIAVSFANGESTDTIKHLISDGTFTEVPLQLDCSAEVKCGAEIATVASLLLNPIIVNKVSLNTTVIKDGFHSEVDVYGTK